MKWCTKKRNKETCYFENVLSDGFGYVARLHQLRGNEQQHDMVLFEKPTLAPQHLLIYLQAFEWWRSGDVPKSE